MWFNPPCFIVPFLIFHFFFRFPYLCHVSLLSVVFSMFVTCDLPVNYPQLCPAVTYDSLISPVDLSIPPCSLAILFVLLFSCLLFFSSIVPVHCFNSLSNQKYYANISPLFFLKWFHSLLECGNTNEQIHKLNENIVNMQKG